jgi:hypothetical protein
MRAVVAGTDAARTACRLNSPHEPYLHCPHSPPSQQRAASHVCDSPPPFGCLVWKVAGLLVRDGRLAHEVTPSPSHPTSLAYLLTCLLTCLLTYSLTHLLYLLARVPGDLGARGLLLADLDDDRCQLVVQGRASALLLFVVRARRVFNDASHSLPLTPAHHPWSLPGDVAGTCTRTSTPTPPPSTPYRAARRVASPASPNCLVCRYRIDLAAEKVTRSLKLLAFDVPQVDGTRRGSNLTITVPSSFVLTIPAPSSSVLTIPGA